ncbi:DUF6283 family protein [Frankia sp. AgB32]|uniref:DUF6283 family protein n=1 Tax=Frankia sp. AgB32 TaxID=631119 RepID=UPI00200DACFD|nr:DUF6283 family protein [Frankia sp. AgB32]MCK9897669.1 DUF6283 family protein [Frankia sp. AgB32]
MTEPEPDLPVHRVAAVVWLDLPADTYADAASHVDGAISRGCPVSVRYPAVRPCGTCPWRRAADPSGADIPGYSLELMRGLARTVPGPGEGDGWRDIMSCHTDRRDEPCRGYLAVEGLTNLRVRVLAMTGAVPLGAVQDACVELDLYGSYAEMRAAHEAAAGAR